MSRLVNDTCKYYLRYWYWYFLMKVSTIPILLQTFGESYRRYFYRYFFAAISCTHNCIPWPFLVVKNDGWCRPVHCRATGITPMAGCDSVSYCRQSELPLRHPIHVSRPRCVQRDVHTEVGDEKSIHASHSYTLLAYLHEPIHGVLYNSTWISKSRPLDSAGCWHE